QARNYTIDVFRRVRFDEEHRCFVWSTDHFLHGGKGSVNPRAASVFDDSGDLEWLVQYLDLLAYSSVVRIRPDVVDDDFIRSMEEAALEENKRTSDGLERLRIDAVYRLNCPIRVDLGHHWSNSRYAGNFLRDLLADRNRHRRGAERHDDSGVRSAQDDV